MATEKRKMHRVVDAAGTLVQVLPETSAEQVTIADAGNKFTSENVEGALQELATGVANAGKVDDVQDVNGASIVTNKIAKLSKAAVGLGNVDNTADANKSVKHATSADSADSAKKLNKKLNFISKHGSIDNTCWFDGIVDMNLTLDEVDFQSTNMSQTNTRPTTLKVHLAESGVTAGTYNGITVDSKGRVTKAVDGGYATNTDLNNKLDKAGGSITGDLTIGGNLNVNGSTTTIDSTTLRVEDKLIEVAKSNTTKLTTPAGIVVPKYDGTNYGALVIDGDGNAKVGDVVLDSSGNIDVNNSDLQTLATRTGLVDGNLVKYDGTNQTLVDTGKKVGDLQGKLKAGSHISIATDGTISATDVATAAQGATADAAKAKADTNATDIANIKNGTTIVGGAANVTTSINGKPLGDIFESDKVTVKNASYAQRATTAHDAAVADTLNHMFKVDDRGSNGFQFMGDKDCFLRFNAKESSSNVKDLLVKTEDLYSNGTKSGTMVIVSLNTTGVTAGQYSAVNVDAKGRVTAGGKSIEWGTSGQTTPSGDLMVGGLFMELQE